MIPEISVIITAYNEEDTIRDCLTSLQNQNSAVPFEIIVVDSSGDRTASIIRDEFPHVKLITSRQRRYCGGARNLGFAQARGSIIAFLDADCSAAPDWVRQIAKVYEGDCAAAGGTIANREPAGITAWASYFCEYSAYMPGSAPGVRRDMAGANLSYRRDLLQRFGPFIEGTYASDSALNERLFEHGITICYRPQIKIFHRSISAVSKFIRHEYIHGRSYASVRVRHLHFARWRIYIYPCIFPLIAVKLFFEIAQRVIRYNIYIRRFIAAVPLIIAGLTAWSLGECIGYLRTSS